MATTLARQTYHILKRTFPQYNKYTLDCLAEVLLALFSHQRFTLRHIASRLDGPANVKHKLKRLQNFLDRLELTHTFWKSFIDTLFCLPYMRLHQRKRITLLIDVTTLKEDYWVLAASISYRGRSIPVYLKLWEEVNSSYKYWPRVKGFLQELKALLPEKFSYEIIGDRGFSGTDMFTLCKKLEWDQVIRINGNYKMKTAGGREFIQLHLWQEGHYRDIILGKTKPVEFLNVCIYSHPASRAERWYLASSLKDPEETVRDYKRRMWIEETFKDLKSVLKWESYTRKIPQNGRLEKLIILSCLSYAIQVCVGTQVDIPPSEEQKTSLLQRLRHIYTSAYQKTERLYMKMIRAFMMRHLRLQQAA